MREPLRIFAEIVREFVRIQHLPYPFRDDDDATPWPREIGLGGGLVVYISKQIDQLIADAAREMRNRSNLQGSFSAADYQKYVRTAFGPALAAVDLAEDQAQSARRVQAEVEAKVAADIDWILANGGLEYAFGCTLFSYRAAQPLGIGPVRFESREVWLERKTSDGRSARIGPRGTIERFDHKIANGPVSKVSQRRILRAWQGEKMKARRPSADSRNEHDIISAIGDCPYVCSVMVPGSGNNSGKNKALIASRLALTTISLLWERPSKALDGLNLLFDREMRHQALISFTSDGLILGGSSRSNMPHAPWVKQEELDTLLREMSNEFAVAGKSIEWLLDPVANSSRPAVLNLLVQSMLWFHDGCRETTDLKAIVCFSSCLEILAGGGGRESIYRLISARIGLGKNTALLRDGMTVKEVVDQIYDDGRTRMIHGPVRNGNHVWADKFGHDWSETRDVAEKLARMCLISCLGLAAANDADDSRLFVR